MSKHTKVQVSFRLPAHLVERVDARAVAWRRALPGVRVTRTDMVLVLLEAGLRSQDAQPPNIVGLMVRGQGGTEE